MPRAPGLPGLPRLPNKAGLFGAIRALPNKPALSGRVSTSRNKEKMLVDSLFLFAKQSRFIRRHRRRWELLPNKVTLSGTPSARCLIRHTLGPLPHLRAFGPCPIPPRPQSRNSSAPRPLRCTPVKSYRSPCYNGPHVQSQGPSRPLRPDPTRPNPRGRGPRERTPS